MTKKMMRVLLSLGPVAVMLIIAIILLLLYGHPSQNPTTQLLLALAASALFCVVSIATLLLRRYRREALRIIAEHEAAHVVVAHYLGFSPWTATIIKNRRSNSDGHAQHLSVVGQEGTDWGNTVVYLAGREENLLRYGEASGAGSDEAFALHYAGRHCGLTGGTPADVLSAAADEARRVVHLYRSDIDRVADALMENRSLGRLDLLALIRTVPRHLPANT